MSFLTAIWLLPVALLLHEAEEWNILRWEQRNFVNLPAKTNAGVRTFLVFFTLFGFLWTALAAGAFLNALQHLFYTLYFRQYTPGVITSVVCISRSWVISQPERLKSILCRSHMLWC